MAYDIITNNPRLKAHYCSSCFKDAVQLRRRLVRTAEITARVFDEITPDGTLFYGVIEGNAEEIVKLLHELEVPGEQYHPDSTRVELGWWVLEDISGEIRNRFLAWYEESYPTFSRLVVEKIPLDGDKAETMTLYGDAISS